MFRARVIGGVLTVDVGYDKPLMRSFIFTPEEAEALAAQINAGAEAVDAAAKERERVVSFVKRLSESPFWEGSQLKLICEAIERGDHTKGGAE